MTHYYDVNMAPQFLTCKLQQSSDALANDGWPQMTYVHLLSDIRRRHVNDNPPLAVYPRWPDALVQDVADHRGNKGTLDVNVDETRAGDINLFVQW